MVLGLNLKDIVAEVKKMQFNKIKIVLFTVVTIPIQKDQTIFKEISKSPFQNLYIFIRSIFNLFPS